MKTCDQCGKKAQTVEVRITDEMGVRYCEFCPDCVKKYWNDPRVLPTRFKDMPDAEPFFMTTTNGFEGYRIVEYKGIVFDESLTGIGFRTTMKSFGDMFASLSGDQMKAVTDRMGQLKEELVFRLKYKARQLGANALVGIDFETTFPGPDAIMMSANGTAVRIRKSKEKPD